MERVLNFGVNPNDDDAAKIARVKASMDRLARCYDSLRRDRRADTSEGRAAKIALRVLQKQLRSMVPARCDGCRASLRLNA